MTDRLPIDLRWDAELALANLDDCLEDLKDLLEIFLRQTPRLLRDIRSALENNDAQKLHIASHTLRGSLQILCADAAESLAGALETAGQQGRIADGTQLLPKLEEELAVITQQVQTYLATH